MAAWMNESDKVCSVITIKEELESDSEEEMKSVSSKKDEVALCEYTATIIKKEENNNGKLIHCENTSNLIQKEVRNNFVQQSTYIDNFVQLACICGQANNHCLCAKSLNNSTSNKRNNKVSPVPIIFNKEIEFSDKLIKTKVNVDLHSKVIIIKDEEEFSNDEELGITELNQNKIFSGEEELCGKESNGLNRSKINSGQQLCDKKFIREVKVFCDTTKENITLNAKKLEQNNKNVCAEFVKIEEVIELHSEVIIKEECGYNKNSSLLSTIEKLKRSIEAEEALKAKSSTDFALGQFQVNTFEEDESYTMPSIQIHNRSRMMKRQKPLFIQSNVTSEKKINEVRNPYMHLNEILSENNENSLSDSDEDNFPNNYNEYLSERAHNKSINSFVHKSQFEINKKVHTGKRSYVCNVCKKTFIQKAELNRHIRIHTGEKLFKCEKCGKCFVHKGHLRRHIMAHVGDKPFKCNECEKSFVQKEALKRHEVMIHSGDETFNLPEKLFQCDICMKKFLRVGDLQIHIRVHTGEKPFMCDKCGKSFIEEKVLKKHYRIHRGVKPYKCDRCGKSFYEKNYLKTHYRIHTGEKPYKCKDCGKNFSVKSNLNHHYRLHHFAEQ